MNIEMMVNLGFKYGHGQDELLSDIQILLSISLIKNFE